MKKLIVYVLLVACIPFINGCAVGMAMMGKAEPSMDDLMIGTPIDRVHFIMREYIPAVTILEGQRVETYDVQIGNEPSAMRAIGHLAMDVITWGLWEVVGTPVEALVTSRLTLVITYEETEEGKLIVSDIQSGKKTGGL